MFKRRVLALAYRETVLRIQTFRPQAVGMLAHCVLRIAYPRVGCVYCCAWRMAYGVSVHMASRCSVRCTSEAPNLKLIDATRSWIAQDAL